MKSRSGHGWFSCPLQRNADLPERPATARTRFSKKTEGSVFSLALGAMGCRMVRCLYHVSTAVLVEEPPLARASEGEVTQKECGRDATHQPSDQGRRLACVRRRN